jgi:hypothetical protein
MKKLLKFLLLAELIYLVVVNSALQLSLTQEVVNRIRPEKFQVNWESAWTPYPFRVYATGISANGQSRSQQWQVAVPQASGSISVLPLIAKRVWIRNVSARDVSYRQRPRLKPDKDYTQLLPHFPEIDGRELLAADTSPRKKKRPWHVTLNNARLTGDNRFWVYQLQGQASGEAALDLTYETAGGPFSLDAHALNLELHQLTLNGDNPVFERGTLQGALGFAPFVPSANKGAAMLEFLQLDLEVAVDLINLGFINLFLLNLEGVSVGGEGEAQGVLRYQQGEVLAGTALAVSSPELSVTVAQHNIRGAGDIELARGEQTHQLLDLVFEFSDLNVQHQQESTPLLQGEALTLGVGGSGYVLPREAEHDENLRLSFAIDGLAVSDLSVLQRYLPQKWPFSLLGGEGKLSGEATVSTTSVAIDLLLQSDRAEAGVADYHFNTDLAAALKIHNPNIFEHRTRVSGSYIRLGGAQVQRQGRADHAAWEASLEIEEGKIGVLARNRKAGGDHFVDVLTQLGQVPMKDVLAESTGEFVFNAKVSDLAWLSLFLGESYHADIAGEGDLQGELHLNAGLPAAGTDIVIRSDSLQVRLLDYLARGDGRIELKVEEGGSLPDWQLAVQLRNARMKRSGDTLETIEQVSMQLEALVEDVNFQRGDKDYQLQLSIDSALVSDMSVFNRYLPADGAMAITGGQAQLAAQLLLQANDADGWLTLESQAMEALLGEQELRAHLLAQVKVVGGVPAQMRFDVTGSSLQLDEVQVKGDKGVFSGEYWSARLDMQKALVHWQTPLELDAQARIAISDSRPFVTLFNNQGWAPRFLNQLLTITDIEGDATLQVANQTLVVPDALVTSDRVQLGVRGSFGPAPARDGRLYLRYDNTDVLLKIDHGKKNLDVLKAQQKYDGYRVAPLFGQQLQP